MLKPGLLTVPSAKYLARSVIVLTVSGKSASVDATISPSESITASSLRSFASSANVLIVEVGNSFSTCSNITSIHLSAAPNSNLSVIALAFLAISAISASILKPGLLTVPSARYCARSTIVSTVSPESNLAVVTAAPSVSIIASSSMFATSSPTVLIVEVGNSTAICSSTKSTQSSAAPSSNLSVIALIFLAISAISASILKPGLVTLPSAKYLARSVMVSTVSPESSPVTLNISPAEPITASSSRSFTSSANVLIVEVGNSTTT